MTMQQSETERRNPHLARQPSNGPHVTRDRREFESARKLRTLRQVVARQERLQITPVEAPFLVFRVRQVVRGTRNDVVDVAIGQRGRARRSDR